MRKVYIIIKKNGSSSSIFEVWGSKIQAKKRVDVLNLPLIRDDETMSSEGWYELCSYEILR